jgi:hypothetical protein
MTDDQIIAANARVIITSISIRDCYRMAFAVGAGVTAGFFAVVGLVLLAHAVLRAVFG